MMKGESGGWLPITSKSSSSMSRSISMSACPGEEKWRGSSSMDAGEFASLCSDCVGVMASRFGTFRGGDGGSEGRRGRFDGEG